MLHCVIHGGLLSFFDPRSHGLCASVPKDTALFGVRAELGDSNCNCYP